MRVLSCFTFTILLVVSLSAAAFAGEVVVPFVSAQAEMTDAGDGKVVPSIPDFSSFTSPGDPALPLTAIRVLLPPNADVRTLRIEIRNPIEEELPDTFDVAPTPPFVTYIDGQRIEDWCGKQIENGKNIAVYGKDEFFPSSYTALDYEGKLDSFLLVPVGFRPYRWNPVTGKMLHLVSGQVAVMFDTVATTQSITPASPFVTNRLNNLGVANLQQVGEWYSTQKLAAGELTPLAIITTSAIVSSSTKFADYVTHKTNMGFNVTVATEADWGGGTGDAAAEHIRAWLRANYQTKAAYALLIGNPDPTTGDVPMKMLWPFHTCDPAAEFMPNDFYYADMSGNWDLDGDGYYGEVNGDETTPPDDLGLGGPDVVAEVIVGRIPYYGVMADLDKILQKIINYESATEVGDWAQRMLLPMKPYDEYTPNWQLGEAIRNDTAKPVGLGCYRIYDEDYGLMPLPEKTPCNESNVKDEWQKGYGVVIGATHGWQQGASDIITSPNCSSLDDTKPAFTFLASCSTGAPELSDNLGYSLLRNGAIATVSSSRPGPCYIQGQTGGFDSGDLGQSMTYAYAKNLARYRQRCGDAYFNMNARQPIGFWPNHIVMNVYGDPTVAPRWPTTPVTVETTFLPVCKIGQSYKADLIASGGTIPYTWTLQSGSLPTGLTLSTQGTISGTPRGSGIYTFTVAVSDALGATSAKSFTIEIYMRVYYIGLDTDPGWTCEGGWAYGTPTGEGSSRRDPMAGHTGSNVYGYNLNGDYPNNMASTEYLATSAFDCSSLSHSKLIFWRWLGVARPPNDQANIDVSTDGSTWATVWTNTEYIYGLFDSTWAQQTIDLSALVDGQPHVYIRWGMGPTNSSDTYYGWNLDDIEIEGVLTKPFIRHTPYPDTDVTTGYYYITAEVLSPAELSPDNPVLHWKTTGEFTDVVMALISGNTYRCAIPAQPVDTTVSYYFAAADAGGTAVSPTDAPTQCYQFNVICDMTPPVIVHTPLPNAKNASGYLVYATITDNTGIYSATLTHSKNGGTPATIAMTKTGNPNVPNEYLATIPSPASVGDWFTYKITATDSSQKRLQSTNPTVGWYMFSVLPSLTRIYNFPLDSNPGWSCQGAWAYGVPAGGGSNGKDPTSGYTGNYVYGYNLNGDYLNSMAARYLTTTAIDCGNITNTTLRYRRWLGVEGYGADRATVAVSPNDGSWSVVWHNPETSFCDTSWVQEMFDISSVADMMADVYIRWGMGPTNYAITYPGWNIDDVEIWGLQYNPVGSISEIKKMPNRAMLTMQGYVVSATYLGYFYIQDPEIHQGIRVAWPGAVTEGSQVRVCGMLRTRNGEREIVASGVTPVVQINEAGPVRPIAMNIPALGGGNFGLQAGVWGWSWVLTAPETWECKFHLFNGLNNVGTLVKLAGKITQVGSDYFYIDDGSGIQDGTSIGTTHNVGVRVAWPGTGLSSDQFVTVVGISSGFVSNGIFLRCVLPRRAEDISLQ